MKVNTAPLFQKYFFYVVNYKKYKTNNVFYVKAKNE